MTSETMAMQRVLNLEEEKKTTLNQFYNDLYTRKIRPENIWPEIADIREAVEVMVLKIANAVEEISPRFMISEVVLVGSAREETQIIRPEEYDFLLILGMLSQPGVLEIKKTCKDRENCVHVVMKDEDVKRQFADVIVGEELRSTQDMLPFSLNKGLRESFYNVLMEALNKLTNHVIQTPTGMLVIKRNSLAVHGPALNPYFQWHSLDGAIMEISVDLCPVIKLKGDYSDIINLETVTCETYYHCAREVGSMVLLPCKRGLSCHNGLCFSVNFTETEILLMNKISEHHRKCYMILKYLINANLKPSLGGVFDWVENMESPETAFFSYILKVIVLQHHYELMCTETTCLASCIERLLHKILTISLFTSNTISGLLSRKGWLSSPFFKKHNIWNSHRGNIRYRDVNVKLRILLINLDFIGRTKEYKFENCHIMSVRAIRMDQLDMHLHTAVTASIWAIYMYPDFGHSAEMLCRVFTWKLIEFVRMMNYLESPIECKNENCCVSAAERKELMLKYDNELSIDYLIFVGAIEVSILSIYIYPDFGHSIGDLASFFGRKLLQLYKKL